jgi:alpha-L-arabinofuranosidase
MDEGAGEVIVKLVNTGSAKKEARITLNGAQRVGPGGKAFVLQSEDLKAENSLDHPTKVAPVEKQLQLSGSGFSYEVLPRSFTVLRVPLR